MTDPATSPAPPVVPGYALTEVIGRGASSTVWSARSVESQQLVAVKVTSPSGHDLEDVVRIAAREQAILQRVSSEHVVRLHETLPLEDGSVALVLDLADAGSLQDLVTIRGALDLGEIVTIFTPVATTLGELHAGGVVHSDLSPGNILFTHSGKPMLSDYDGARLVGEQHPHTVSGTRGFVAPEVYRGGLPTEASDVWSLAALVWYAVTGGSTPPAEDVDAAAATLGPELADVLVPMLAADPASRPSAPHVAVAVYRASTPTPVRLAGRNPDAASAMTHRIRQEAALELSSSGKVASAGLTSGAAAGAGTSTRRRATRGPTAPATARTAKEPRPQLSVGIRLVIVLVAALLVTGGLLFLLAKVNATQAPVSSTAAATGTPATTKVTGGDPAGRLQADPGTVVQGLADARGTALMRPTRPEWSWRRSRTRPPMRATSRRWRP